MPTHGMEPEEPKQVRPEVVDDIVWVLEHSCGDVDVTATVLQLFDASEAESTQRSLSQENGLLCRVTRTPRRCGRRSHGCSSTRCQATRVNLMTRRRPDSGPRAWTPDR